MMKQLTFLVLIYFIFSNGLFSQIEFSTKIGLSSLQDVGFEMSAPINEKKKIYTGMDYRYQSFYLVSTGILSSELVSSFNNNGFTIRLGVKSRRQKTKKNKVKHLWFANSVFYRRLEGVQTIRNINFFGSDSNYEVKYVYQDLVFSLHRERIFNERLSLYSSLGFGIRKASILHLDNFTSKNELRPLFIFDIGIRLNLFSIK